MTADWKDAFEPVHDFAKGVSRLFLSATLIGYRDLRLRRWMLIPHRAFWAVQAVFEVDGMNRKEIKLQAMLITFRVGDLFLRAFWVILLRVLS